MPVYCYRCKDCGHSFEVKHKMSFENQKCLKCESGEVFKIPSLSEKIIIKKGSRTGAIVDKYIEDVKKEIKQEKQKLSTEEL